MDSVSLAVERLERSGEALDALTGKRAANGAAHDATSALRAFVVLDIRDLMAHQFKPRDCMLSPWLRTQSLNMVHAWRGIGKTHFALNLAYAVASGGQWLNWKADKPRKVLYLDGEMPGASFQQRVAAIGLASDKEPQPGFLRVLTPDTQPDGITPNLATAEGREAVNAMIEVDTALVIVDNLSALVRGAGPENDAQSWEKVADWALPLRARGHSVLFVHHSGKNGTQRGTSKKEDILDSVLSLKRPSDYDMREGARFEIHFEKGRDDKGADVEPVEAHLTENGRGASEWAWRSVENAEIKRAADMKNEGASQADIAEELGKSRFQVGRLLRHAAAQGMTDSATFTAKASRKGDGKLVRALRKDAGANSDE